MDKPVLAIMAAGLGSRYKGLKQVDPVGLNGEIIMDFSIYAAMQAGFEKVKKKWTLSLNNQSGTGYPDSWKWNMLFSGWTICLKDMLCLKAELSPGAQGMQCWHAEIS